MQHYCAGHYSKSVNLCLVAVVVVVPTVLACTCTLYSDQYRVLLSPTAVWYGSNIPSVRYDICVGVPISCLFTKIIGACLAKYLNRFFNVKGKGLLVLEAFSVIVKLQTSL